MGVGWGGWGRISRAGTELVARVLVTRGSSPTPAHHSPSLTHHVPSQDEEGGGSTAIVPSKAERRGSSTRGGQLGGTAKASTQKELERKISEVELDRTLCMNRIAQVCNGRVHVTW